MVEAASVAAVSVVRHGEGHDSCSPNQCNSCNAQATTLTRMLMANVAIACESTFLLHNTGTAIVHALSADTVLGTQ